MKWTSIKACDRDSIAYVTLLAYLGLNAARRNTETERKLFTSSKPFTWCLQPQLNVKDVMISFFTQLQEISLWSGKY